MSFLQQQDTETLSQDTFDDEYSFPVSFAQQRLWFLERLLGPSSLYNIHQAIRLEGRLDVSALQQSLDTIVSRHEALRTYFVEENGDPLQVIKAVMPIDLSVRGLSASFQANQNHEIQRLLEAEANRPFDLEQTPLLRALLVKVSEQEHILLVTVHHIVSDGWSMGVFRQELAYIYNRFSQKKTVDLPELPIQYADYAVWQREWLTGETLERQLSYWKQQLADLTVLELPTDRPRPKQLTYRGAKAIMHWSSDLAGRLKTLSQQQNATLFMTLSAALQVLLHRYSGQDDIVIGTAIAGRHRQELEKLIGFFVNTLTLRVDLSGAPSFKQVLGRVREVCLNAYAHQDLPFEKLVAELQVQRDMSRHPLFQVMLVLQPSTLFDAQFPGLRSSQLTVNNETAKFDLSFSFVEHDDGLTGTIEYSTDLFDAQTIQRLMGHFQTLVEGIIERPETPIAELPLLTPPERQQLLVDWNATQADYPKDLCVHQLFEAQVAKTPDATALIFADRPMSYQALNAKANQLAHYLRKRGVRTDTRAAICMDRCIDLVVGLLAILKAGGGYAPLDPSYPQERLAFMLEDTEAPVLLTHSSLAGHFPRFSGQFVCLDQCRSDLERESTDNPSNQTSPNNLAYVIYTSGSTGTPKGVEICHYNIARLLLNNPYARFDREQRFLLLAPITFDASTFEVWGGLLHGACCVIHPERIPTLKGLETIIVQQRISILWLTAALFNAVIDAKPEILSTVAQILTGGEALSTGHIQRALALLPESRLINGYGPTESTTFTCCFPIPKTISHQTASIPIGRPIANTRVYILDKRLQPVPIGVAGELHIGGDGLARGYLHRPELTAEKFIDDPFAEDQQARLYKTGDLARYLSDGAIEFLGRMDQQVKLRGFRIELGEIESVLEHYPGVREVVVVVREEQSGDKRLVAYLTHSHQEMADVNAMGHFLKEKLPDYMVPSAFVVLDQMPKTINGKIDRKALPAPEHTNTENEHVYVSPRSLLEEKLVVIWREVLNINRIGIQDNFFEMGGHSLLAIVLCTKVESQIGKSLPVEWVFRFPTIETLSAALEKEGAADFEGQNFNPVITAFQMKGRRPPLFWLHGGKVVPMLLEQLGDEQPLYFLNHQSQDGYQAKYLTIPEMADYYLQNILQVDPDGPYYLGGYSIGGMIIYEIARQLCERGKKVALLFILDPTSISDAVNNQGRPVQKFKLLEEYHKLKHIGYVTYLLDKASPVLTEFNEKWERMKIHAYFCFRRKLPSSLVWPYLMNIYEQARRVYQPPPPPELIEKTVLVHVNNRGIEDWSSLFDGKIDTLSIDCKHLQLIEKSHMVTWLRILKETIKKQQAGR